MGDLLKQHLFNKSGSPSLTLKTSKGKLGLYLYFCIEIYPEVIYMRLKENNFFLETHINTLADRNFQKMKIWLEKPSVKVKIDTEGFRIRREDDPKLLVHVPILFINVSKI